MAAATVSSLSEDPNVVELITTLRRRGAATKSDSELKRELYYVLQIANQIGAIGVLGGNAMPIVQECTDLATVLLSASGLWPVDRSVTLSREYFERKEEYITAMESSGASWNQAVAVACAKHLCAAGLVPPDDIVRGLRQLLDSGVRTAGRLLAEGLSQGA